MNTRLCVVLSILVAIGFAFVSTASADPLPGELLKFYQMPLNNAAIPYLVPFPGSYPAGSSYGTVPSIAPFPGHDELSTAWRTSPTAPYTGEYMADDFADYAGTPITHVRWWGSYLGEQQHTGPPVTRFLISFEHNVPASVNPANGAIIPSHPDFTNPGNLHQIVTLTGGTTPPPPGFFTSKFVPTPVPVGSPPPAEGLYEYNAELNLDRWFNEKRAVAGENNVYWLKIVALVDEQETGHLQWGWHNRDWSIKNDLAALPGDTPDGAERFIPAAVPGGGIWHFEDDAVNGGITVFTTAAGGPIPASVIQQGFTPQNYLPPLDGPSVIGQYSKDLAFELYTRIPEPAAFALLCLGWAAASLIGGMYKRR
jgi:hypothetical protein